MTTTWTQSSYCGTGSCVEATYENERVLVRDSIGTVIELRPDVWEVDLEQVAAGRTPTNAHSYPDGRVEWRGVPPYAGTLPVTLRYDADEWATFVAGVKAGEFGVEALAAA